jgi:glucosamine-phosphate N-acetyltransferase
MARLLQAEDYSSYLKLLSQLTNVGEYSFQKWMTTFHQITEQQGLEIYVICDDCQPDRIIAAGTLLMEPKFIHGGSKVAHIEDVVVDNEIRGKGLGIRIVDHLVKRARELGAYKVILDCKEEMEGFYKKCGFFKNEIQMRQNIDTNLKSSLDDIYK